MQHKHERRIIMPPKAKYTREEIVEAALKIVAEKGTDALTARELGAAIGTSTRPIFTAFRNMEDVLDEVKTAAMRLFESYSEKTDKAAPAFKQVGLQMIIFAREQPKLYRLLYMSEKPEAQSFEDVFTNLGEIAQTCIDVIKRDYGLDENEAKQLFKQLWIYTYGIGTLIATGMCSFDMDEAQKMLTLEFVATLALLKQERAKK